MFPDVVVSPFSHLVFSRDESCVRSQVMPWFVSMPACNPELPLVGADAAGCRVSWHACIHPRTHIAPILTSIHPCSRMHAYTPTPSTQFWSPMALGQKMEQAELRGLVCVRQCVYACMRAGTYS